MKILLTGGHLSPALSVIDKLRKSDSILVVGRKYTFEGDRSFSFEYQTFTRLNISFKAITTGRLQRTFTKHTIPSLLKFPVGFIEALRIVKNFKPDAILSFGGYISLPVVLSGFFLGVPIVIHEQTLSAGLANKIAAFFATKICISWVSSEKFFPKEKTILTGLPMKKFSISNFPFAIVQSNLPVIYITGGSAGSHTINNLIEVFIKKLLEQFIVIHQTGDSYFNDFDRLNTLRENLSDKLKGRYILTKFINADDIGAVLKRADLVVSRSGINTLFELMYFEKPSLLIPLNSEQEENAQFMESNKIAKVISQDVTADVLYDSIFYMYNNIASYTKNSKAVKNSLVLGGAEKVVSVLESVVKNG